MAARAHAVDDRAEAEKVLRMLPLKYPEAKPCVRWHGAMRPGKRKKLDKANNPIDALIDKVEKRKRASAPRRRPRFAWSSLSI